MNGRDRVYWQENAAGHVFLSDPQAPIKPGFDMYSTTSSVEMDRVFARIDRQEKKRYSEMTESIFLAQQDFIEQNRSNIRQKIAQSANTSEREFLQMWLKAFDNKMDKLLKNTVYGVAAMQKFDEHGYKVSNEEMQHKVEVIKKTEAVQ